MIIVEIDLMCCLPRVCVGHCGPVSEDLLILVALKQVPMHWVHMFPGSGFRMFSRSDCGEVTSEFHTIVETTIQKKENAKMRNLIFDIVAIICSFPVLRNASTFQAPAAAFYPIFSRHQTDLCQRLRHQPRPSKRP